MRINSFRLTMATMALLAGTLLATGPARAGLIYNFSFIPTGSVTTPINTISGTFEVDASTIIDITGNASYGGAITGLLPPGVFFGNDNIFSDTAPYLTFDGVSFSTVGTDLNLFWYAPDSVWWVQDSQSGGSYGSLSVTPAVTGVPEPATLALAGVALLGMAAALRRHARV